MTAAALSQSYRAVNFFGLFFRPTTPLSLNGAEGHHADEFDGDVDRDDRAVLTRGRSYAGASDCGFHAHALRDPCPGVGRADRPRGRHDHQPRGDESPWPSSSSLGEVSAVGALDAGDFNTRLRRLETPAECATLFEKAIRPFGFDTFASGEVDLHDRSRSSFHIINWPESWAKFYRESGLIDRDPIVEGLIHRTSAFTWSDLRADRSFSRLGTQGLELAATAGWVEGLVVPLPQASGRIGLVSLAGNRDCTDPAERQYLTLISVCLHSYVRTLIGRHGFAQPPAGLTPRELEAVRLVARGMSDAAIGRALGIADSTAHEFVEKAKRKMKVRSRPELAALAAALAIVDL